MAGNGAGKPAGLNKYLSCIDSYFVTEIALQHILSQICTKFVSSYNEKCLKMTNRERLKIRKRMILTGSRELRLSARKASLNAQRASRVLDIPYTVLQDGIIYTVHKDKQEVSGKILRKVTPEKTGLRKGTKLCL